MSEEGSIFNFMALVQESEAKEAQAPEAPFKLEQQNQKIIFQKVRAKNFRSVGNEWMEIDFLKSKSTLVVSEDNGSGKSTLTVWAPYYALFDKPYNPKELKAALVNSSTNKDAMVELFFNVRGKNWLVRRGYKPSVFELFSQDQEGAWVKEQAPAAMKDQQKYLESIIGFDAKIAENVMILGADKFTPFVEMDAPSRRHVVEKIWDLAVFPVMLKVAKEDVAILIREVEDCSRTIDSQKEKLRHSSEMLEQINSKRTLLESLELRVGVLNERRVEVMIESSALKIAHAANEEQLKIEISLLSSELDVVRRGIEEKYATALESKRRAVEVAKEAGQVEIDQALSALNVELAELTERLRALSEEEEEALKALNAEGGRLYAELNGQLKNALSESEKVVAGIRKSRSEYVFPRHSELEASLSSLMKLEEQQREFEGELDAQQAMLTDSALKLQDVRNKLGVAESARGQKALQRKEIEDQIAAFEHMGTCPTCSQIVGSEAVESFKKTFESKLWDCDTTTLDAEIESLKQAVEAEQKVGNDIFRRVEALRQSLSDIETQASRLCSEIRFIEDEKAGEKTAWDSVTEEMAATAKAEFTQGVRSKINDLVADTKVAQANLKSEWEEKKREVRSSIDNQQAKIAQVKAEVGAAAAAKVSAAESELSNAKSVFDAEVTKVTASIETQLKTKENGLVDAARMYCQTQGRLIAELKQLDSDISAAEVEVETLQTSITDESSKQQTLIDEIQTNLVGLEHDHQVTSNRVSVYKKLINQLGDKEAKAEIIKAYMPFLNHKVNEYLDALNLHVGFKMDENFSIEFTAPDRKRQTTWSLSKGQAMRMNLAVLFALRDVANLKASVSTNLLIMDETLEALSERGVQEIMEMFEHRFKDINMFVVTQRKAEFTEYFTDVVNYGLRGGFTVQLD